MKNVHEVLHEKEAELARIRYEIASLRIVAPLLSADFPAENAEREASNSDEDNPEGRAQSEGTGTDGFSTFAAVSRPRIWNVLKRGK